MKKKLLILTVITAAVLVVVYLVVMIRTGQENRDLILAIARDHGGLRYDVNAAGYPNKIFVVQFTWQSEHIADYLEKLSTFPDIESIDVTGCDLKGVNLRCLSRLKKLQFVTLDSTNITNESLKHIADIPNLFRLNIRNTEITAEGIKQLPKDIEITADGTSINPQEVQSWNVSIDYAKEELANYEAIAALLRKLEQQGLSACYYRLAEDDPSSYIAYIVIDDSAIVNAEQMEHILESLEEIAELIPTHLYFYGKDYAPNPRWLDAFMKRASQTKVTAIIFACLNISPSTRELLDHSESLEEVKFSSCTGAIEPVNIFHGTGTIQIKGQ